MRSGELADLPNFKASFSEPMRGMGIISTADLIEILMDEQKTKALVDAIHGLGPRTVDMWKDIIIGKKVNDSFHGVKEEMPATIVPEEHDGKTPSDEAAYDQTEERPCLQPTIEEERVEGNIETNTNSESSQLVGPRNIYCGIDDLYNIRQTLVDLFQWNGAKKKGLASIIEYVERRLKDACVTVSTVEDEDSDPLALIASKGTGGPVFWGHLDTAPEGDMDSNLQGVVALDFIYGRGACDVKGALAALLVAVDKMMTWGEPFTVVLSFDGLGRQEGAHLVAQNPLIKDGKGILMLAPTNLIPAYGQLGCVAINVTIFGEDSILSMSAFLTKLKQSISAPSSQQYLRVGLIRGGKRKDPFGPVSSCQASIELITSLPTKDAVSIVDDVLSDYNHLMEIINSSEPLELDPGSDMVRAVEGILREEAIYSAVSTEAAQLIPTIANICLFGPGYVSTYISTKEFVILNDLGKTYELILRLVSHMNASSDR